MLGRGGRVGGSGRRGEELCDGPVDSRDEHVRSDLCERPENKEALVHSRVREVQAGSMTDLGAVDEQIEVDGAGGVAVGGVADAAEGSLDLEEAGEELVGGEEGSEHGGGVEVRPAGPREELIRNDPIHGGLTDKVLIVPV